MRAQVVWARPSSSCALADAELHVWQVSLDQPAERVAQFHLLLATDEQARADRFHFERDRRRYIVARGGLRSIISRYLGAPPEKLAFGYGPQGKPYISRSDSPSPLHFNLAHSHELALYAFTRTAAVGIDIEYVQRQVTEIDQLAERFFSANENALYRALPSTARRGAFFRCWTRKEAFIKAIGEGLSHPLDRFDVTFTADQPPAILSIDGKQDAAQAWSLFHLEPADDYVGAVAVGSRIQHLAGWMYDT